MRIFNLDVKLARKAASTMTPVTGAWSRIAEWFTGAWQQNATPLTTAEVITYPTLYACLARISNDIAKLPYMLKRLDKNGVETEVSNAAYSPVLRKPNSYQTAQQFREAWILSKLMQGNAYVLKQRDARNVVIGMYVLDPSRVQPLISDSGAVYYRIKYQARVDLAPNWSGNKDEVVLPATEIIHDRQNCLFHQLIGVPPLTAAYWPVAKNLHILRAADTFFENNAQPGGILSAPAGISVEDEAVLKKYWEENFSGENRGRVAAIGADVKFTSFAMKYADSQLVEQMTYSDQQICQPFGIPPFLVGLGTLPAGLKAEDLANIYYRFALQTHIEAMEGLLDEGLAVPRPLSVELDIEVLLRMDTEKRATVYGVMRDKGIATPNEARRAFNFPPLVGGDTVYMQQQDYPLDQVAQNKIAPPTPPPLGDDEDSTEDAIAAFDEETGA